MANKPLQTIKFPGLTDTYTVPQVDSNFVGTAGQVPDSKKVHDEISELKEDIADMQNDLSAVPAQVDGIIKNDYLTYRADMVALVGSGDIQKFDKSLYEVKNYGSAYKYYQNAVVGMSENGLYYPNPIGKMQMVTVTFYDSNDAQLTITENSNTVSSLSVTEWNYLKKIDGTHIDEVFITNESNFYKGKIYQTKSYVLSGTIAYAKVTYLRTKTFTDSTDIGVTFGDYYNIYIPYGKAYTLNRELADDLWDKFTELNKFYDVPEKRLNPWMQRSYGLSENILDDRMFDWTGDAYGQYYTLKPDCYIPVIGGKTIMCNKAMRDCSWYDAQKVRIGGEHIGMWTPVELPQDAAYITFRVYIGTAKNSIPANTYQPIMVYYTDNRLYPWDAVDETPLPQGQINGWDINKNVYDYAVPDCDSNLVRMMKAFAIREINRQRDAFRIGTFNVYVNRNRENRPTIKRELETYGLDMCCFQETRNIHDRGGQINLGDYLKGWQFQYCNTNAETEANGRALASAYEVLSSEVVTFTANTSNSYLHCVIQLPRYKDYADGLTTLSLYTYHGFVSSADTRTAEVTQMLSAIAQDAADFIVVTGDTNDFSENKDIWQMFNNAGLTPVHNGESETVTDRNNSIDNIFVSSHITCLYYNVINSNEWTYVPSSGGNPIPVSDHDLLYADLQFDFEAVISARQ